MRSCAPYTYELLEQLPGAVDLIAVLASNLYRSPEGFEVELGLPAELSMRFVPSSPTSAIGTLRRLPDRAIVSFSLLVSGVDVNADAITLQTLQKQLLKELRDTPHEPSFDLLSIKERPLVATMAFADPTSGPGCHLAALADRCMAAAYFRYCQLA